MSKPRKVCICGHARGVHPTQFEPLQVRCLGGDWQDCGCEGWQEPARVSERLIFGVHRIPRRAAETAPAWARPEPDDDA